MQDNKQNNNLTGLDALYVSQVKDLLYIISPFINAGVRLPEADIRIVRGITERLKDLHSRMEF